MHWDKRRNKTCRKNDMEDTFSYFHKPVWKERFRKFYIDFVRFGVESYRTTISWNRWVFYDPMPVGKEGRINKTFGKNLQVIL